MSVLVQHVVDVKRLAAFIFSRVDANVESYWVSELLRSRVQRAGFTPCLRIDHLRAVDARARPELLSPIEVHQRPTPQLLIRHMANDYSRVSPVRNERVLWIERGHVTENQVIIVADCVHAEVHAVQRVTLSRGGSLVELFEPIMFQYQPMAWAGEWVTERFFMQQSKQGQMALYYQHHRVDRLSTWIKRFSATRRSVQKAIIVHAEWGMDDSMAWALDTRVRSW